MREIFILQEQSPNGNNDKCSKTENSTKRFWNTSLCLLQNIECLKRKMQNSLRSKQDPIAFCYVPKSVQLLLLSIRDLLESMIKNSLRFDSTARMKV